MPAVNVPEHTMGDKSLTEQDIHFEVVDLVIRGFGFSRVPGFCEWLFGSQEPKSLFRAQLSWAAPPRFYPSIFGLPLGQEDLMNNSSGELVATFQVVD
jgi:hypothetical protein